MDSGDRRRTEQMLVGVLHAEFAVARHNVGTRAHRRRYLGRADLLLAEAELFSPVTQLDVLGSDRQCFATARAVAARYGTVLYAEGVAIDELGIVIEHAWCVDATSGEVIETTWSTPGGAYLGFALSPAWMRRHDVGRPLLDVGSGIVTSLYDHGVPDEMCIRGLGRQIGITQS